MGISPQHRRSEPLAVLHWMRRQLQMWRDFSCWAPWGADALLGLAVGMEGILGQDMEQRGAWMGWIKRAAFLLPLVVPVLICRVPPMWTSSQCSEILRTLGGTSPQFRQGRQPPQSTGDLPRVAGSQVATVVSSVPGAHRLES